MQQPFDEVRESRDYAHNTDRDTDCDRDSNQGRRVSYTSDIRWLELYHGLPNKRNIRIRYKSIHLVSGTK